MVIRFQGMRKKCLIKAFYVLGSCGGWKALRLPEADGAGGHAAVGGAWEFSVGPAQLEMPVGVKGKILKFTA